MAIVLKDNEKLYLMGWEYNLARTLTEFAKMITANGGRLKPLKNAIVYDRSLDSEIIDIEYRLASLEDLESKKTNDIRKKYIENETKRLEALKAEQAARTGCLVTHTSYIIFEFNGIYYNLSFCDNPLFDHHIYKTPVNNGKYSQDACGEALPIGKIIDLLWHRDCPESTITEAAEMLYNIAVNAECSIIRRDSRKVRVANFYNSGYHYETVFAPERIAKIDF